MEWVCLTPSIHFKVHDNCVDRALDELSISESTDFDTYHALHRELYSYLHTKSDCLNDVLHEGPSVVILEDAGRGWRLEVQASNGRAVTFRRVGSWCMGQKRAEACKQAVAW